MKSKLKIIIPIGIAVIAIALAFVFIRFAPTKESVDIGTMISTAQQYLTEQKYEQAVAEFQKIIDIDPKNVDAYIGLAKAYIGLGDTDKAVEVLEDGYDKTGDERIKQLIEELMPEVTESPEALTTAETTIPMTEETTIDSTVTTTATVIEETVHLIIVPDLRGKTEEEALKIGEEIGIKIVVQREPSNEIPEGKVISQDISGGSEIEDGEKIVVIVSEGKKLKYAVELIEEYYREYDREIGDYKETYKLKSDYDFSKVNVMKKYGVEYPYICQHGDKDDGAVAVAGGDNDDPTRDIEYEGEMYYSIETGTDSINLSTKYYYVSQFSEGLAFFQRDLKKGKDKKSHVRGYNNTTGEEVFSYLYTDTSWGGSNGSGSYEGFFMDSTSLPERDMYDMYYGYAAYENNSEDGVGVVDSKGNVIIKPAYYSVDIAGDGIFRVAEMDDWSKYGYITALGKRITKCEFDYAGEFINGLAAVGYENDGKYTKGVINQKGKWVVPCKYSYCLIEDNGLIVAFNDDYDYETGKTNVEFYCFDKDGKQVLDSSYSAILTGNNTGCEYTLGEANDRILAQDYDGIVYLYDLSGKLIAKTKGDLQYNRMLHDGGGNGPWSFLFDVTGVVWLGENTYMDKDGNVYAEHPYGLPIGREFDVDPLARYYTTCEHVNGYDNIYIIKSYYENTYIRYYRITPNK